MSIDAREPSRPHWLPQPRLQEPENGSSSSPPPTSASDRRVGLTPLTLLLVLIVGYLLIQIQFVLVLVLLSLVFATVIQRPVNALERRHVPRPVAILLMYIAIIGAITALFLILSPAIQEQSVLFREQAPQSLAELRSAWLRSGNALLAGPGQQALGRAIAFITNPDQAQGLSVPQGAALGFVTGLGGGIIGLVTVLIISFYYLMEKSWIRRIVLLDSAPETRIRVSRIWDEVEQKVGDWLRGQLTLCLVVGVTATIGYAVIGVPFWPLLGLWDGVTRFIPILGPWLGAVPAVIIALTQGGQTAAQVVGFILLLQLTENAILLPRIMRGAVGLSPLAVTVAILAGTELARVAGALLAIPVAAVIQVLLSHYTEARREAMRVERATLPGWRWMRGSILPPAFAPVVPNARGEDGPGESDVSTNGMPGWRADVLSRASAKQEDPNPPERSVADVQER